MDGWWRRGQLSDLPEDEVAGESDFHAFGDGSCRADDCRGIEEEEKEFQPTERV